MKFVIQRVTHASVEVEEQIVGKIGKGYLVLIGVGANDTKADADKLIRKMIGLRIFSDGSLLLVSQFTLYANCIKGNRPSFTEAGNPALAEELYEYIIAECRKQIPIVETGVFGAHMQVSMCNSGPFTIILESDKLH